MCDGRPDTQHRLNSRCNRHHSIVTLDGSNGPIARRAMHLQRCAHPIIQASSRDRQSPPNLRVHQPGSPSRPPAPDAARSALASALRVSSSIPTRYAYLPLGHERLLDDEVRAMTGGWRDSQRSPVDARLLHQIAVEQAIRKLMTRQLTHGKP
jgi:hypothetical protein